MEPPNLLRARTAPSSRITCTDLPLMVAVLPNERSRNSSPSRTWPSLVGGGDLSLLDTCKPSPARSLRAAEAGGSRHQRTTPERCRQALVALEHAPLHSTRLQLPLISRRREMPRVRGRVVPLDIRLSNRNDPHRCQHRIHPAGRLSWVRALEVASGQSAGATGSRPGPLV